MSEFFLLTYWWAFFVFLGFISLPLASKLFNNFIDAGFGLSKTIGVLIISYVSFTFGIFRIFPFEREWLFLILACYLLTNIYLLKKDTKALIDKVRQSWLILLLQEIVFSAGFFFWAWVRGHHPDINGLEKFMDFGFINSIMRSEYLPPNDMWLAGLKINYYWFGHFYTALVTKLTGIQPDIAYNLMLATILGLTLSGAFSLVTSLTRVLMKKTNLKKSVAAGLISSVILVFGGNFHTPFYAIKDGVDKYWYPDATRFIGYNPETNDKTIHEFPLYSFVVSDLHGHVLNLPFVILFISLLFSYFFENGPAKRDPAVQEKLKIGNSKNRTVIFLGFVLGVMFMTSTWDFGNYLIFSGVSIALFNFVKNRRGIFKTLQNIFWSSMFLLIIGIIVASPFILNFESIAQGVDFVKNRTPAWQLFILWGYPATLALIFLGVILKNKKSLVVSDFFVLSLLTTSLILIVLPEIIFVKDIYIASHHRANTMFKLTYQAFVMSYLTSGYIAVRSIAAARLFLPKLGLAFLFAAIFALVLWYPKFAINSYYGDFENYKTLSGEAWLKDKHKGIYESVQWLKKNTKGQPVILEAAGDSYTEYNLVSSYTGLPTVSGWFVHEWLWRGTPEVPSQRSADVEIIYTTGSIEETKHLLDKYNVSYIIVGPFEREKYRSLNIEKINDISKMVFSSNNTAIYKVH